MASVGGVSSSNTVSSLMNSANMISGLASGLDTESMIESLVKSYQTKINQLNQKVTKTEWKQDAYRSIIQKMVGFSNKYTSYTSNTNLMSPGFFNNAVKVLTKGAFADSVTASGKTGSDISLDAVHQLATAAQYRTKSNLVSGETGTIAGSGVDLSMTAGKDIELSNLKGSLRLTYGTKVVSLNFNETTDVDLFKDARNKLAKDQGVDAKDVSDTDVLAEVINQKLADQKITFSNGNSESADKRIKAVAGNDGSITFKELGTADNGVYISGAGGNLAGQLGLNEDDLENAKESKITTIDASSITGGEDGGLTRKLNSIQYLAEKGGAVMNMSLDGSTKQITMPRVEYEENYDGETYYINGEKVAKADLAKKYTEALQTEVQKAFKDKVSVENKGTDGKLQLEFKVKNEGSDLIINSDVGDALGIGNTATSYLNTSKSLKDLMKTGGDGGLAGLTAVTDEDGKEVLDDKGKKQYDFMLNGVKIGTYTEDTKLSTILSDINSNKNAGVSVSYSQSTQNFTFKSKETGADSEIKMGEGLAQAIFGKAENSKFDASEKVGNLLAKDTDYSAKINSIDNAGFKMDGYNLSFNIDENDSVNDVVNKINAELKAIGEVPGFDFKYTARFDEETNSIQIRDDNTGKDVVISDAKGIAKDLFSAIEKNTSSTYTAGQDAIFTATINGEQKTMTRSSNSVNIDGLTINMEDTFNSKVDDSTKSGYAVEDAKKSVTFQSKTDSDKIIDAIKSMVEDYNTMMSEIKSAYSTMPYQKSNGSFANYEPLTDEDREGMSESAIERYEAKAKQGILFGDRNLSSLYTKMNRAFSFSNQADVDTLKDMGISISFNISDGAQSITIDEDKLRSMLDSDPDRVADLFTKTDGIMDRMKTQLDAYAKTTGEPKGILIQQAGSPLSSLSLMNNQWQKEIDNYNTQIEKWQDKLTSQVEKYTSQFARLEQLIQQMNSQSSTLAGLMGGG